MKHVLFVVLLTWVYTVAFPDGPNFNYISVSPLTQNGSEVTQFECKQDAFDFIGAFNKCPDVNQPANDPNNPNPCYVGVSECYIWEGRTHILF